MISKAEILKKDGQIYEAKPYNSVTFDERLDEQLDTGSIQLILADEGVSFADFCAVSLTIKDEDGNRKRMPFCGFKTVEKRGEGYYILTLELVEPTRILMGTIIEGRKVTQPIEGSGEAKKTLYDVTKSLLKTFETLPWEDGIAIPRFGLQENAKSVSLLKLTESPEFHWEAGTLLWECLVDIGNVINAIPRLLHTSLKGKYTVTFDTINDVTDEYEL